MFLFYNKFINEGFHHFICFIFFKQLLSMSSDFEKLKSVVLTRESVRAFSGEPLEKGVLEEILGYALVISEFDFSYSVHQHPIIYNPIE